MATKAGNASPTSSSSDDASPHKHHKATDRTRKNASKPKRKKIPTYYRRKARAQPEEMDRLEEEKKRLEEAVKDLEDRADVLRPREALQRCQHSNKVLREVLHAQRRAIAGAASIIAHHFCTGPFDTPTKLSKDPVKRRAALMKMRSQRLSCAYEFMMEMLRHMDVTLDFCEQKSAQRQAGFYDTVEAFVSNMEISMSEVDGDITIRENDEPQLSINVPVAQHRFVTTIANMVQMDTNNAAFAEYRPPGPGVEEIGFSINDPIDEDELYPYRPETTCRVRQDVTVIIMVAKHRDKEGNPLIVFSRWWSLCLRKSHIHVPKLIADRIRNGLESVSASMLAAAERAGAGGPTGGSVAVI
ncbi:hypothetical protein GN244_ATG15128 [Phytophthora infestans]|uniref:Uncharacterized protein n=1 Tax=Phytophthora infestans TaxID=4787 RepID=A0A833SVK0_PHYIN|nr:hypothetical protein GN244_ATG15128 [Phytophthora infestans]KAF4127751.1 hypothetical protein GN958_ATG22982 [Phytophthora infestans]